MKKRAAKVRRKKKKGKGPDILKYLKSPLGLAWVGLVVVAVIFEVWMTSSGDLVKDFVSKKEKNRLYAFQKLSKMDPKEKAAVSMKLVPYLKSDDKNVRFWALDAVGSMREDSGGAVAAVLKVLKEDKDPGLQEKAGRTLGYIGKPAAVAIPDLIAGLKDRNDGIRAGAAAGLAGIAPDDPAMIPIFTAALKDENPDVRASVAGAFWAMGVGARPALKAILAALKDGNDQVRASSARSLASMKADPDRVVGPLIGMLTTDQSRDVRREAAVALGEIGPEAKRAVPSLMLYVQDSSYPSLQVNAIQALGKMGSWSRDAVPSLIKVMNGSDKDLAHASMDALDRIGGPQALDAVAAYRAKNK